MRVAETQVITLTSQGLIALASGKTTTRPRFPDLNTKALYIKSPLDAFKLGKE